MVRARPQDPPHPARARWRDPPGTDDPDSPYRLSPAIYLADNAQLAVRYSRREQLSLGGFEGDRRGNRALVQGQVIGDGPLLGVGDHVLDRPTGAPFVLVDDPFQQMFIGDATAGDVDRGHNPHPPAIDAHMHLIVQIRRNVARLGHDFGVGIRPAHHALVHASRRTVGRIAGTR